MAIQFAIKQGDTLMLQGQLVQDDGTPIDLTDVTITSQIRDTSGLLVSNGAAIFASALPATGNFTLTWQSDTTWPVGSLRCDVRYVGTGMSVHSDTFNVRVSAAVTQS